MLDNHVYNLLSQLTEEHRSLWRIKNEYMKDAGDCQKCLDFWEKLAMEKEQHVKDLVGLIKSHLDQS